MLELVRHIEKLLDEHECVIIPDFGGFIIYQETSKYVYEDQSFLPPSSTLIFNKNLTINDGVLVQSYMLKDNISYEQATKKLYDDILCLKKTMQRDDRTEFGRLGYFKENMKGEFSFFSYEINKVVPELYGLDFFEMKELSLIDKNEVKEQITYNRSEKKPAKVIDINTFLKYAAVVVIGILTFFSISTDLGSSYNTNGVYSSLFPEEIFRGIEEVQESSKINIRDERKEDASAVLNNKIEADVDHKKVSNDKKIEEPKKEISDKRYHIIAMGGISRAVAEKVANTFREDGFSDAMVLDKGGKIRVSIMSFDDVSEANKKLSELRKNSKYESCWLLR